MNIVSDLGHTNDAMISTLCPAESDRWLHQKAPFIKFTILLTTACKMPNSIFYNDVTSNSNTTNSIRRYQSYQTANNHTKTLPNYNGSQDVTKSPTVGLAAMLTSQFWTPQSCLRGCKRFWRVLTTTSDGQRLPIRRSHLGQQSQCGTSRTTERWRKQKKQPHQRQRSLLGLFHETLGSGRRLTPPGLLAAAGHSAQHPWPHCSPA